MFLATKCNSTFVFAPSVRQPAYKSFVSNKPSISKTAISSWKQQRSNAARTGFLVRALDAAMPFDFEARARQRLAQQNKLRIGIVGFGTFGQFLAKRFVQAGHEVLATSRSPYQKIAQDIGVAYYQDADDFCEEHPDIVILATSILSLEQVMASLPVQRLRRNTLFVDVLSVKEFPKNLLLATLPPQVDVLCTHPMFGPDSGKGTWKDLNFMYEKVRISSRQKNQERCEAFLNFFETEGCRMVEMSCEEHDRLAASTQFLTHTVGRTLGSMDLSRTSIDTKGYQSLMTLVENTTNDSFDLYYGLFMYNQNATQELEKLERAFDSVKKQLFDRLHDKLREQMFQVSRTSKSNEQSQQQSSMMHSSSSNTENVLSSDEEDDVRDDNNTPAAAVNGNGHTNSNGNYGQQPDTMRTRDGI